MENGTYKYLAVASELREAIRNGQFPSGKLPTEPELMNRFKVGKITVYHALKCLVDEGIIRRVKSKGTFINGTYGKSVTISGQVAVVMQHSGHVFGDLSRAIWEELKQKGLFAIPIDYYTQAHQPEEFKPFSAHLSLLLNSNIHGIIFSGHSYYMYPFMDEYQHLRSVMINYYDRPGENPFNAVLFDFQQGAYLATKHLLEQGRRNILLLRHHPNIPPYDPKDYPNPIYQVDDGYQQAMKEYGMEDSSRKNIIQRDDEVSFYKQILTENNPPDGMVVNADGDAVKVLKVALDLGIKVPDDLAITGMYNTPWCKESPVPLTSISFEGETLAREAVKLLEADPKKKKIMKIQPKLIIRDSAP